MSNVFKSSLVPSSSGGGNTIDYSTSEQVIGTWIDGSKIYQKTILCTAPTVTTPGVQATASTDIGVNVSKIIDMRFNSTVSGVTTCAPFTTPNHTSDTKNHAMYILANDNSASSDKNKIQVFSSSTGTNNATIYVTIQYTKS